MPTGNKLDGAADRKAADAVDLGRLPDYLDYQVRQAQAAVALTRSTRTPRIEVGVAGAAGGTSLRRTRHAASPTLEAAYEADLWGRIRQMRTAVDADAAAATADTIEARRLIAAQTVTAYVALRAVQPVNLGRDPVFGQDAGRRCQVQKNAFQQGRMVAAHGVGKVRYLRHIPQPADQSGCRCRGPNRIAVRQIFQNQQIAGIGTAGQGRCVGWSFQAGDQTVQRAEIQIGIAPIQSPQRLELVIFNPLNGIRQQQPGLAGYPKSAVRCITAGPAGNL